MYFRRLADNFVTVRTEQNDAWLEFKFHIYAPGKLGYYSVEYGWAGGQGVHDGPLPVELVEPYMDAKLYAEQFEREGTYQTWSREWFA